MFRIAILLGLAGLAAATALIISTGLPAILEALKIAGWGIVWANLFHLVPMFFCVLGWRLLFPGKKRPSFLFMLYTLWLRTSVNSLMPVARIGGEVVSVRVMIKYGVRKSMAVASTVVELTLSILGVFTFDIVGIALFAMHIEDKAMVGKLIGALLFAAPILGGLVLVQRIGFFGILDKIFTLMLRDTWKKIAGNAGQLDRAVHTMYRRRDKIALCYLYQILSWVSGTGEVWLALYFLGHPIPLIEAFMLEALIQAASSLAFAVPGALGVQEAGFMLFGQLLGLPAEQCGALAMVRRCRDLILYVPGLIVWQVQEGRWLLRAKNQQSPATHHQAL